MASPVLPSSGVLSPLGLDSVRLAPGFWGDRVALNREVIIAHCQEWMERAGWIGNFRLGAAGGRPSRQGREFSDSEIYKLLEAMAWADHPALPELAATVARAQEEDGYLNTRWHGERYTDFEWGHELYCYGHLIQAGVARLRTHGEDELTEVVRRAADHVCRRFMDTTETCGHPVVEMALVELYRVTGVERYLEMARRFVERRGPPALADIPFGRAYFQDDLPVRRGARCSAATPYGPMYLACGAVDVAVETGDARAAVGGRGAVGAHRRPADPPDRRHGLAPLRRGLRRGLRAAAGPRLLRDLRRRSARSCSSHRLLLATGDVRYADLAERTLFNVLATAPALDGRSFFYANPLHVRVPATPAGGHQPRARRAACAHRGSPCRAAPTTSPARYASLAGLHRDLRRLRRADPPPHPRRDPPRRPRAARRDRLSVVG